MRCSHCAVATRRASRSPRLSGGDTGTERLRRELDRAVDRLVVDIPGASPRGSGSGGWSRRGRRPTREARESALSRPRPSAPTSSWTKFVSTCVEVDREPGRAPALREPPRPQVVVRQAVDVVVERIDAGGRDDARLAHRAAEQVLLAPRALDRRPPEPASSAPSGQPRPFERQSVTVSNRRPISAAETPVAIDAFRSRAPSRWVRRPRSRAAAVTDNELVERPAAPAGGVVRVPLRARPASGRPTSCSAG